MLTGFRRPPKLSSHARQPTGRMPARSTSRSCPSATLPSCRTSSTSSTSPFCPARRSASLELLVRLSTLHLVHFSLNSNGRAGCGKSTLALSFFRFVEAWAGRIVVDGLDIAKVGLKDLRSRLTIIPQVHIGAHRSSTTSNNLHRTPPSSPERSEKRSTSSPSTRTPRSSRRCEGCTSSSPRRTSRRTSRTARTGRRSLISTRRSPRE